MPPTTQPRMLSTDPRRLATQNARGGINKTSRAELAGERPMGSTGTLENLEVRPTQPLVAPRLNPTIPDIIPSTALAGNKTFEDVMDTRADLETQATAKQQLNDRIKGTNDKIGTPSTLSFSNPGDIINRLQLNRVPTETETMRTQMQNQASQNQRNFAGDIATARTEANAQFGLPDLVARKAEVTQQYAERQNQLDADIKRIEANASKRGVDRAAVEDMKRATQSAALEDLSNLAAIEAAVSGSITEARNIINDTINDKKYAFEQEYKAVQDDIDYYSTLVGEENQRTAQTLQIALDEKKRLDAAQLAKEKEIKDLMVNVATEGADDGTINAIKNATSVEEAIRYASPFLGQTARRKAEADIAQSYASTRASNASAAKSEAELRAIQDTSTGQSNIAIQALDSFSGSLAQNNREQYTKALAGAVKRGNIEQTETALKNAAQSAAGSALREDVIKRDQAIGALRKVQSELDAYAKAGGNTNLLTGGYEDLQNKLGKTSDPKLSAIETRINLALNAYTNAVSGASFTPQESERYASLFPKKSNTSELNTSKINTLIDSFEANNQVFYGNFYGGYTPSQLAEQAVYDELVANATPEQLLELGITQ